MHIKSKFVELLEKSTLTQAYITICVVTTACILWGLGQSIPEGLQSVLLIVVGFFFGSKAASLSQKGQ